MTRYAELQVTTNYSFLRGASHPDELMITAAALGLDAIAVTDRNSLAGVVRAHVAAKQAGIKLVVGARLDLMEGLNLLCYPIDRAAYGRLSRLLTLGKRRAPKGECELTLEDLFEHSEGQIIIALPPLDIAGFDAILHRLAAGFPGRCYLAAHYRYTGDDRRRIGDLAELASLCGTPLVATNDVHAHVASRRPLQDILTCIREGCTIGDAGYRLHMNAERYLKPALEMTRLFKGGEAAVARTAEIADRCRFSLDELRYEYPDELKGQSGSPQQELVRLTWKGAKWRYPKGVPDKVTKALKHELALVAELSYAPYFLTVYDIVRFARGRGILCQGRGSAANSAICYCLGITAVDPDQIDLLFERFISAERDEPPDIDVDFEHERREEVIQYIYETYGRDRAGLAATVITYRTRSAVREVGKALGLSADAIDGFAKLARSWRKGGTLGSAEVAEAGLSTDDRTVRLWLRLVDELLRFPRHLSQHVGGFVITRGALSEVVPIGNAAMDDRTNVEWDKDDLAALGMLKIDVLALGMLSCIRKAFGLLRDHYDRDLGLADVPPGDPQVYDMLCAADSVGVFQVESRAQMTMLPRLKPRNFYDLVIEVAIVRPGPIQGDMVHPYLRRRSGKEPVEYPSKDLERVLGKTLGVPLFQEQAMQIAIVAAGFTPSEADRLRRAMATFRHTGTIHTFEQKMIDGMVARGYDADFAERCFRQIEGFGEYGFPESHAASFALLVYVSAWLKWHYPAVFACAILNSQPMGFYASAQLVRDARDHGVDVRGVDINHSHWDCTLEEGRKGVFALRLGFRQIKGFREVHGAALAAARADGPYASIHDAWAQSGVPVPTLERLAKADGFRSLGHDRRAALWAIRALGADPLPLFAAADLSEEQATKNEPEVTLPDMSIGENVLNDYMSLRLSLKAHPLALLRGPLAQRGLVLSKALETVPLDRSHTVAGLVLVRQRPGTASGVIFMTLEDETGVANIVVWPRTFERYRKVVLMSRLLQVTGKVQREDNVIHLIADHMVDISNQLHELGGVGAESDQAPPKGPVPIPLASGHPRFPKSRDFQ
jgi:error-prone DNA polymerase